MGKLEPLWVQQAKGRNRARRNLAYGKLLEITSGAATRAASRLQWLRLDPDDIDSERSIAVMDAVEAFTPGKGSFVALFRSIFVKKLISIGRANRRRIDRLEADTAIADPRDDIQRFIDTDAARRYYRRISGKLSKLEKQCFDRRLRGLSFSEIAEQLHIHARSADNAVNRARRKLQKEHAVMIAN